MYDTLRERPVERLRLLAVLAKSFGNQLAQLFRELRYNPCDPWAGTIPTRFHEAVASLPDDERETVQLLWYEGLKQPAAAAVLGVSLATLKRRWQSARLRLSESLEDWSVE